MSNTWKYILIGLGVLVVLLLAAAVLWAIFGFGGMHFYSTQPGFRTPFGPFGRMPMMGGRLGIGWIMMLGVMCLPPLLLILLVALIVGLVTRSRPVPPPAQQPSIPQPPAVPMKTCPNCGRPVQADWSHCPYCGQDLVS